MNLPVSEEFNILPAKDIDLGKWDGFVENCDEAWILHLAETQQAVSTWPGKENCSFAVVDANDATKILAVVPCQLIQARVARILPWNAIESHGGPAAAGGLSEALRRRVMDFAFAHLKHLARLNNAYEIRVSLENLAPANRAENQKVINPLIEYGCENTLGQSWILDLRPGIDFLWTNLEKRARTAIRKAEKHKVLIRAAAGEKDLDIYYDLHQKTYRRTGVQPHPKAYFQALWRDFLGAGRSRVLFAEYEGQVVAAENFGVFKKAAVYWSGAASETGLEVQANSLIQWTAIQWMVENGLEWYETGEGFPQVREGKRKGLNDFKKSFGGKLLPLYRGRILTRPQIYRLFELVRAIKRSG